MQRGRPMMQFMRRTCLLTKSGIWNKATRPRPWQEGQGHSFDPGEKVNGCWWITFSRNIWGFTYWKRVLKYLDIDGYKTTDLEECYSLQFGKDLASFTTAAGIASILLKCVDDVTSKQNGKKDVDREFYKLCKRIGCIENPRNLVCDESISSETLEVFSSFRPSVSAAFSAEKLEQVTSLGLTVWWTMCEGRDCCLSHS